MQVRKGPKTRSIKPLGDIVVIAPAEPERQTAAGIIIPDTGQRVPIYGRVVAIGDDVPANRFKVGDWVIFSQYAGVEVMMRQVGSNEEVTLLLMSYKHVLGIVEPEHVASAPNLPAEIEATEVPLS